MKKWLESIEKEYDLKILFSCEAGSRAWGIESSASDFDIRFIYRYQDLRKYLALNQAPAALTFQSPFDGNGFDLFKAFELVLKSNPSIYEWAYSPLIYSDDEHFLQKLKWVIENSYSPKALYMHYGALIKRNLKEMVKGDFSFKKQKQLIQAVRAEIIRTEIRDTAEIRSPFIYFSNAAKTQPRLLSAYCQLSEAKKNHLLLTEKEANEFIKILQQSCKELEAETQLPSKSPSVEILNTWIWDTLGI